MRKLVAADILRTARRSAGVSQAALAEASGISQPVISAYERGRRQPSAAVLDHLLRAIGFRLELAVDDGGPATPYEAARRLSDVLALADALPSEHEKTLRYPPIGRTAAPRQPKR